MSSDITTQASWTPLNTSDFKVPGVVLVGDVDYAMYERFRQQVRDAPGEGLVVVQLSTIGGDPEVARLMGEDIRFHTKTEPERRFAFLGKATVYSAGVTFMSFFATPNRYLARGTRLMIHERQLDKTLELRGALTACMPAARALLHEIEHSIAIQDEGFENLVRGSVVTADEVRNRAQSNWYLKAEEAAALRLIQGVV
jgi:hypothetical protein